jgi:hypothetical protein
MNLISDRKLQIARAQLGTALHLFILDKDPYSVQALSCGGSELIEGLAQAVELPTFSTHIMATFPDFDIAKVKRSRNLYWNAIKHFYKPDGKTQRDDESLLADFSDLKNDAALFVGWWDYFLLTKRLPIEVQVFQAWWYALNEDKLGPCVDPTPFRSVFPSIGGSDRREQKRRLRRKIEAYQNDKALLAHPKTEGGLLVVRSSQLL